jgi:hypothetical protein
MFSLTDFRQVMREELQSVQEAVRAATSNASLANSPFIRPLLSSEFFDAKVTDSQPTDPDYGFYHEWPKQQFHFRDDFTKNWQDYFRSKLEREVSRAGAASGSHEALQIKIHVELITRASIQMFFLHEFYHVNQHLTSYQHAEIEKAPSVLNFTDYHADALSILALFNLCEAGHSDLFEAEKNHGDWRHRLTSLVLAALWGMESFQFGHEPAPATLGIGQFFRYVTWHYQLHRCRSFNQQSGVSFVRLDVLPAIDIRGLRRYEFKDNFVTTDVPPYMKMQGSDPPFLWVGAINPVGLAGVYRLWPTDPGPKIAAFFEGILRADTEKTWPIFAELFDLNRELIGREAGILREPLPDLAQIMGTNARVAPDRAVVLLAQLLAKAGVFPTDRHTRSELLLSFQLDREPEYLALPTDYFPQALIRDICGKGKKESLHSVKEFSISKCAGSVSQQVQTLFDAIAGAID